MNVWQKAGLLVLAVVLELASGAAAARSYPPHFTYGGWRYDLQHTCLTSAAVKLDAAQVTSGHVAVWSGIFSSGGGNWLQAGVGVESDAGPGQSAAQAAGSSFRYVEWQVNWARHLVRLGPGNSLRVRLTQFGDRWRLQAAGRIWTVRIGPRPDCQVGAESWDRYGANMVQGRVILPYGSYTVSLPSS